MTDKIPQNILYIEYLRLADLDCVLNNYADMPQGLYLRRSKASLDEAKELLSIPRNANLEPEPVSQYTQGLERKKICIIGARKHTAYGVLVVKAIIKELVRFNPIIISGLATGIDTIALETALEYNLKTIAVIGSGLDDSSIYPRENIILTHRIEKSGGIIISEYEEGTEASKWHFPRRNRIMAGLADIIIIVEGTRKSGTLITARLGLEYGKDIVCVPGSIFSPLSQGPLSLIEQGAIPLTRIEDIVDLVNTHEIDIQLELQFDNTKDNKYIIEQDENIHNKHRGNINYKNASESPLNLKVIREEQTLAEKYYSCSEEELGILNLLNSPLDRQELLEISQYKLSALQIILIQLEIKGYITEKYGKIVRV